MSDPKPFHRIFGLALFDSFQGTPITVTPEIDLSLKQQFLDLALIRPGPDPIPRPLPDGFEDLGAHNLVTFTSYQESLSAWALCEEVCHYVNYRNSTETSILLYDLFEAYSEDPDMGNILQEYVRQRLDELFKKMPLEERLKGLSPEERLQGLSVDELLNALSPEAREELKRKMQSNGSSPTAKED
jgi:hypothetical protein